MRNNDILVRLAPENTAWNHIQDFNRKVSSVQVLIS